MTERRSAVTTGILLAGLGAALLIFITAAPPPDSDGERQEDTKQYRRQMEMYGGKANVLASEMRERFEALWHGRNLAFTVAFLASLLAAGSFVALTPLPRDADPPDSGADEHEKPGA